VITTTAAPGGVGAVDTGSITSNANFVNLPAAAIGGFNAAGAALTLFNASLSRFLTLEVSALEADGRGKIISSPRVITADKVKASIEQGTEIPYQAASSAATPTSSSRRRRCGWRSLRRSRRRARSSWT